MDGSRGTEVEPRNGDVAGSHAAAEAEAAWVALVERDIDRWSATESAALRAGMDSEEFVVAEFAAELGDAPSVAEMPTGVGLASALDVVPLGHVDAHELGDVVAGWERLIAWAQARQAAAAAELTSREEMRAGEGHGRNSLHPVPVTASELCLTWPWTKPQAQRVVDQGVQLRDVFPAVHRALLEGRIDTRRAKIITDVLRGHEAALVERILAAVLPHVHAWTSVKVGRVVRRLLHELAPESMKERREKARKDRTVWMEPDADGMAWLHAYLTAEEAAAIMAALTAATSGDAQPDHNAADADHDAADHNAQPNDNADHNAQPDQATADHAAHPDQATAGHAAAGPPPTAAQQGRSAGERRADALAAMAWASLTSGRLGGTGCAECGSAFGEPLARAHGRAVTVNVTVPWSTLLGLDEQPGELDGYGPIDADTARRLAAAGVWRWIGTDPAGGWALDYGRTRYTPPQDLVDYVLLRDRECRMPGCHQPAYRCEIDHRIPYPEGPTSACNCSALCRSCHLQKHHAGWSVEQVAPGTQRWTSPTGRTQTVTLPRIAPAAHAGPGPDSEPDPPPDPPPGAPFDERVAPLDDIPPF
ncbi:HNH endonuclease [Actinobacteria bacterium YIM 96077]|uniref:HNH nuclease domain-containing protein n=1 Tax=Phytoactinopolyspora halophila TaxID=1981511 RepID=A0A329QSU4_9ACTN|nr:HNH endonuclease signature motif containing protein [Phytoactinopolyspora halophila]AYY12324.1 HNH endonuclease [Actinobacteria bacterium YIM 96077]RAW13758.1 hypothetical protein DPM12_12175 [Phytoactinopolyspora halophila]